MGQTLTHGVYLPDEGERNCYSGLAANWQILDTSVGTIAAHTAALAGKAPLVHTHSKSDITDFPAYGNTAGTICEGNDSRLSDARTPVAHTHGKADITDLLNSNFIPSANNTYDLGSSSYQWNNLYAKNYFYNGVAWGLDKANTWSAEQIIEQATTAIPATLKLKSTNIKAGDAVPSSLKTVGSLSFTGSDGVNMGFMDLRDSALGNTFIRILARQKYDANGNRASNGTTYEAGIDLAVLNDRSSVLNPSFTGVMHLGTSANKWKSFNGINPGALSLPSENASSVNLDPTNWVTDGSNYNSYTPPSNGWLAIQVHSADITDLTSQYVFAGRATGGTDYWPQGGLGILKMVDDHNAKLVGQIFIPVISGKNYHITIKINKTQTEGSIIYARFYPCQGNV